jgi:hypothetical protein
MKFENLGIELEKHLHTISAFEEIVTDFNNLISELDINGEYSELYIQEDDLNWRTVKTTIKITIWFKIFMFFILVV